MRTLSIFAAFGAALALAACTPGSAIWHKEGATDEELVLARRVCEREADRYAFAMESGRSRDELTGEQRRAGSVSGGIYRECMERQGWRRVRGT
jgi:hypothetical protein